eukprot:COSAG02_NODE_9432_length_2219_cov_1.503302_2_plen_39_part_00
METRTWVAVRVSLSLSEVRQHLLRATFAVKIQIIILCQ